MKKIFASLVVLLAIASVAVGLRAATNDETSTDLSQVKVTAYRGATPLISMSGTDCASVFYVLPLEVKTRIADEWDKFARTAREQGSYSGVKYSFRKDLTFEWNGYKIVATNVTPELVNRILSTIE
jgi:hypothetical protein